MMSSAEQSTDQTNIAQSTPPEDDEDLAKYPDGGWGWVIAISCLALNSIADGYQYCFGLIFIEILEEFGAPSGQTSLITGIFTFTYCLVSPLASGVENNLGGKGNVYIGATLMTVGIISSAFVPNVWMLYITFGLCSGVGSGMLMFTASTNCCLWFEKKRAIASGFALCGTGVGAFLLPLLTSFLLSEYGWRGACLLLGGIVLQCFVFGSLLWKLPLKYVRRQEEISTDDIPTHRHSRSHLDVFTMEADGQSMLSLNRPVSVKEPPNACSLTRIKTLLRTVFDPVLLKNPIFLINLISKVVSTLSFKTVMLFLPARAETYGFSRQEAALQVSVIGIMNILGRLLFGSLSNHGKVKPFQLYLFSSSFFICALASFFSYTPTMVSQMTFAVFFGLGYSGSALLFVVELADSLGMELFAAAYGGIYFTNSISALLGPPLGGWLFDQTQSYLSIFIFGGTALTISGAVLLFIPCIELKKRRAAEAKEKLEEEAKLEHLKVNDEESMQQYSDSEAKKMMTADRDSMTSLHSYHTSTEEKTADN